VSIHPWSMSRTEQAMACPASMALPQESTPPNDAAVSGTAIHEYLENFANIGRDKALALVPSDAPQRERCEKIDLLPILARATKIETEVAVAYNPIEDTGRVLPKTQAKRDYTGALECEIPGTIDLVLTMGDASVYVADYKTGKVPVPVADNGQTLLLSLALCRARGLPGCTRGVITIGEEGQITEDMAVVTSMDLAVMAARVVAVWDEITEAHYAIGRGQPITLHPGSPQCDYCAAKPYCPYHNQLADALARTPLDKITALLLQDQRDEVMECISATFQFLPSESLGRAWVLYSAMKEILDWARKQIERRVIAEKGLPLPDGRRVVPCKGAESINGKLALSVLRKHFGSDPGDLDGVIEPTVSRAAIERECKQRSGSNFKQAQAKVEQIMVDLSEAGAIIINKPFCKAVGRKGE